MEPKRLYRSRKDKILAGICGGIGKYLDIDPIIIRLIFIVLLLTVGSGILIYLIAWILIPLEPEDAEFVVKE
ncbi:phage shock protein C, PspC [Methanospirillum hungatei JF-1]|uniref:Phage shock protein C, PspC n=1 Tax=Methanospirillum hungatei JF-1 (strain ATCC 27890 / DSM 864 / NBRC 100397 / JF-1) TaxID=323259 RepID=Q2FS73_METHJ|nr:PspC domain-containing protein [Methanospirillum hungatei]ABD42627.1 phage shock protein C, PspC [Methanospirillum hungatei JF-1]MCA1915053.1 PspC domain-containing protein [Methanospirillum hungatei]HOW03838.1 PspC domain-containing protein [Methanospirillum hungatei]